MGDDAGLPAPEEQGTGVCHLQTKGRILRAALMHVLYVCRLRSKHIINVLLNGFTPVLSKTFLIYTKYGFLVTFCLHDNICR